ncbi:MAG: response regulator [Lachnospiraceae bacterium]|nr:response regulator [Lachnospiraceae bacterium]
MYYSAIGLLAILQLIIVNRDILFPSKASFVKPAWKVYRRFLLAVLLYYLTDVLWGIFESRKLTGLLFADTTVYFIAMALGILFWAEYTVTYLEEKSAFGRFMILAGRIVPGLITAVVVVNVFTPVLFTVDEDCVYHALTVRYVVLTCQIIMLVILAVYALSSMILAGRDAQKKGRYQILASFGIIMALCLFIQLWFPYLPIYSIAYMLGTSLLHSFVASDEKEKMKHEQEEAQKLTELKDRFRSLLDNIPGMTFTKDAETGVYLACNQAFAAYAHKESPEAVVGLTDAQIFDPKTAEHFVSADKIALSLSKPYVFFEDVPDAAGNQRQLQTTKLKYVDTAGRLCVLGICQDITDTVRIQHEQAMTKEAYERAVSTGLMYTNIAQTLARDYMDLYYVNTDTEEYVEYQNGEDGNSFTEVRRGWHFFSDCKMELAGKVYEEDREAFLQAMHRKTLMKALDKKDTFIMTYRVIKESGPSYVTMKISRMDASYVIMGITDVDAEMRETTAKNQALAEALDQAEQANRAKTVFLSGMSHELRTPMNAIIGMDALALKNENLDDETREYLEKIGDSSKHLLSIINDILDMSRIESGRVQLHNAEFSFMAMMEQICTMVRTQCHDKGLKFECNIQKQVEATYFGDDVKIREMLLNILSNAIKFTNAPGNVTLTVEKTAELEGQSMICFKVKDTGIGMDKSYLPKIFDAFSQENAGNKTKYGSSGLGMAITKRIVDMMNGTISVTSQKGVGTEFTVTLPLRNSDAKALDLQRKIDISALYVLVVDDDPIEAEHARVVLEEVGIRADACTSGQEALRKLEVQHAKKKPYNMILMDWNMPGMSGSETAAEIHRIYEKECTVVALTAYSWDDIREEAHAAFVDNFLSKPLFTTNLVDSMELIARRSDMKVFEKKQQAKLKGRRILMAEDMELNAEILADILKLDDILVDHAENGKVALEMFEKSTAGIYAAILMDIRMPVMDGLEATKAIRALDRPDAKKIPIIALTANAFDEDVQRSMQAGMNAHLSKPVEIGHLIQILGELIYEAENGN